MDVLLAAGHAARSRSSAVTSAAGLNVGAAAFVPGGAAAATDAPNESDNTADADADADACDRPIAPLATLAAESIGRRAGQLRLDDAALHDLLTALPDDAARRSAVAALLRGAECAVAAWSPDAVPDEALRALRSFDTRNLDLCFMPLDRAKLGMLLSTQHSETACPLAEDHVPAGPDDDDDPEASWEAIAPPMFCTLHEFRLGSLTNLDLSFCSLLDPGDASLAELFSRALPNLRGLFVAGCFGQENGVLTIRQIIRRLDLAVLDISHNLLVSMSELRLMSTRFSSHLPNLHTLYVHDCPLVGPPMARSWHLTEHRSLQVLHVGKDQ